MQSGEPLYLAQDSHWSPAGMKRAAAAVAERVLAGDRRMRGDVAYDLRPAFVRRHGDIVRMGTEGWKRIELPGHGRSAQP